MSYKPSDVAYAEFVTSNFSTGAAATADSLPTGTFNRNGTDDGAVTVTVTNLDTGRYKASWTIPSGAAAGDTCMVTIAATVNSVAGKGVVWQAVLDGARVSEVAAYVDTEVAAIKAKTDNLPASPAAVGSAMTLATDAVSAAALAADAVTELQTGLATASVQTAIKAKTDLLPAAPAAVGDIPSASAIATQVNTTLSSAHGSGDWGGGGSSVLYGEDGSIPYTFTVYDTDGITPLADVAVFVSSDVAGTYRSQTKLTDALGKVQFDLDAAVVYFWLSRFDKTFSNPISETVS